MVAHTLTLRLTGFNNDDLPLFAALYRRTDGQTYCLPSTSAGCMVAHTLTLRLTGWNNDDLPLFAAVYRRADGQTSCL
jgi:hypothetical protein